jgi:hypothetical protein
MERRTWCGLHVFSVEGLRGEGIKINIVDTAYIDARLTERFAVRKRLYATDHTKEVIDMLFVEVIERQMLLTLGELELICIDEVKDKAFLGAM